MKLYDFTGKEIRTLLDSDQFSGENRFDFDASQLPSGQYFLKGWFNGRVSVGKMLKI